MRFKRLQGVFEIGAEGGEQAVQGGSRKAVDDGAVGEGDARVKAGGEQGTSFAECAGTSNGWPRRDNSRRALSPECGRLRGRLSGVDR